MKKITLLTYMVLACVTHGVAQDFLGIRNGNYSGVNGAIYNPANLADSRYKFDLNLFSVSANVGNNNASFNLKNISEIGDEDFIKNQLLSSTAGASSAFLSVDFHGPSLMLNVGKKMGVALTTRVRAMANVIDIDGKLIDKVSNDFSNDPSLPYTISSQSNMRFNVNGWTEYGVSVGRVIRDEGEHFIKAGLSLKYLAGAGNGFLSIDNLNATINEDVVAGDNYLSNSTGKIAAGFGGVSLTDFDASELLKSKSTGLGADIGFVYEFRPTHETYKKEDGNLKRNYNKYKFKVGVSLLDLGSIKYNKDMQRSGAYDVNITGNERFYLNELDQLDVEDYNAFFSSKPQFFTPDNSNNESTYKVSLPSTIQLDLDYHLHRGFYVSAATQFSVVSKNTKAYNSRYNNNITITPRYEGKAIGLYVPIGYSDLTKFNAGVSLRLGPLFIGSGSAITALIGNTKQADVFMGLRFGLLQ